MIRVKKLVVILALALAAHARAADGGATARHSGTVVDDNGRPVAGATVDCYRYQSSERFRSGDREPELTQRTVTDSKGAFTVPSAPGATLVVVKKPGLSTAWKTWTIGLDDSSDPLVLSTPTSLAGTVLDQYNQPVALAEVWVAGAITGDEYSTAAQENELFGQPARECFSVLTTMDGRFRIVNFPAGGRAGLAVKVSGKAQRPVGDGFQGSLDHQSGEEDIELRVGPAGSVEGQVLVAEGGQPPAGVIIKLEPAKPGFFGSEFRETIQSAADGTYRIPDVQPGLYNLTAAVSGLLVPDWVGVPGFNQVTVVAGETVRDTVVYVSKGALVEVTVAITNDAKPLANVPVSSSQSTAYTGANGVALLRVPTGKSWFSARNNWRSQNTEVEVQAGLTNHVRIELPTPPSISGTVRDASGAPAPRSLVSFHPGQYPDAPDYSEVTTDKNGRYEVTLKLSREDMGWDGPISETNAIMARDPERNLVAIQEFKELPTNLDLVLQPGITLSGSVKDTQGAPVTNATVDLRFLLGRMLPPWTPQPAKVNAQGLFSFTAMPQGRQYFIQQVTAKGYGAAYSEVKAEDTKTNHYEFPAFVLKRADRKLSGQVLGQDGKPFAGAEVNFSGVGQPRRQIWSSASVKSDTNGRFAFDAVCEGQVTVSVNYNNTRGNISAQGGDTNVVVRLGVNLVNYGQNQAPPRNIAGTVRDPSGAPAPGVTMSLNPVQGRTIDTQTDSDGRYEFTWQPRRSGEPATWLLARDVKNGYAAIHPVDEQTTNLDLTMQVGLTLSTRVQDSGGRQLTNATAITTVWAEPNRGFSLNPQPMIRDDDGLFRLNALPQGLHYALRVESPGYSFARLDAEAGDTKTIFLALPPSILAATNHQVAGVVLGLDGKPAPFVAMQLLARDQGVQQSQTDSDGRFVFEGLGLGPVVVYAGGRSGAASAWGGDTNLVIRMQPPGSAANPASRNIASAQVTNSGTVLDPSGAPAPGVFLSVGPSFGTNNKIQSDSAGNYALHWTTVPIRGIVNASLLARDPEHNWAAFAALDATTKNLDLRLQPGFTLSGAVRDADGKPLAGAAVLIYLRLPGPGSASQSLPPTNTDAQGVFSLGALPRGAACTVDVAAAGYGSNTTTAPSSKTQTSQLKLPPIALKLANQIVAGRVVGEDGKPCWGAQVTVRGEGQPAPKPGRTDSNGNFVLQDVCQGPVEVRAVLSAGMNQGRTLVGVLQANGGETNLIVRLGMQNGVPAVFPVDQGPGPVNRPSAPSASQP